MPSSATADPPPGGAPATRRPLPPLLAGLHAARANLVPGLCLQALMIASVYSYYRIPAARPWFDRLGALKQSGGYLFSAIAASLAGGVLPETLKLAWLQRDRPWCRALGDLLFGSVFWAVNGMIVDAMYRAQGFWFGTAASFVVLAKKVFVDQFIYNPVFAGPFTVGCYEWKNRGYAWNAIPRMFTVGFYVRRVLPTLIATWGVWVPVVCFVYSLPPLLQTPLFSCALCFWALMLAYLNPHTPPQS